MKGKFGKSSGQFSSSAIHHRRSVSRQCSQECLTTFARKILKFARTFSKKISIFFARTMASVSCPECNDDSHVRCFGGGSRGKYKYMCLKCPNQVQWQQERPRPGAPPGEKTRIVNKGSYKCGVCGAFPKKGHVCLGKTSKCGGDDRKRAAPLPQARASFQQASDIQDLMEEGAASSVKPKRGKKSSEGDQTDVRPFSGMESWTLPMPFAPTSSSMHPN